MIPLVIKHVIGSSQFIRKRGVFDGHILELAGIEDFAALDALDKLGVFFSGHDLYTRMLALFHIGSLLGGLFGVVCNHKSGLCASLVGGNDICRKFPYF
jgi:hypothetical protein